MYGGIETGGTKTVVAVGWPDRITALEEFPTGDDPGVTLRRAAAFLLSHGPLNAVGVASFGPCDPDPSSAHYGRVTTTPKPGWGGADVLGGLREAGIAGPLAFDTDVNAAALAEWRADGGHTSCLLYVTVGTGIGGGAIVAGRPLHGALHPEMGHQRIPGAPGPGVCPYHGSCWEGVAAGPAIRAREGVPARDVPIGRAAWRLEAQLLAVGLANIAMVLSCERIVLGGGIGAQPHIHELVRPLLAESIAGYIPVPELVPPALGRQSGVRGALAMAADAAAAEEGP